MAKPPKKVVIQKGSTRRRMIVRTKKKPQERGGGGELIDKGVAGPSEGSIAKVFGEIKRREFSKTQKIGTSLGYLQMLHKLIKEQNSMASKSALDAAGLDPQKPREKRIRSVVQDILGESGGIEALLSGGVLHIKDRDQGEREVETAHKGAMALIAREKGPEAAERFSEAFHAHRKKIARVVEKIV